MLVVLDAGVFVSAAITPGGVASRIITAGVEGRFEYVLCPPDPPVTVIGLRVFLELARRQHLSQEAPPSSSLSAAGVGAVEAGVHAEERLLVGPGWEDNGRVSASDDGTGPSRIA